MKTKNIVIAGAIIFFSLSMYFLHSRLNPKEPFARAMLSFRFDDAYASQREALALLDENNIKVSVYCITGFAGTPGYMSWEEIRKLAENGHEIGSHSVTHNALAMLLPARLEEEIQMSSRMLREKNIRAVSFAWPYGLRNPWGLSQLKTCYDNSLDYPWCARLRLNGRNTGRYALMCSAPQNSGEFESFLRIAVRQKLWLVACFHRIGENPDRFTISFEEFKKIVHCAVAMKNSGSVDIVTVSEGARFVK